MLVKGPMKSALDADLARLKALIEEAGAPGPRP
jgi:hypothetical protein